jgi:3'(2'), 5'-bisphosphate nucleotidase
MIIKASTVVPALNQCFLGCLASIAEGAGHLMLNIYSSQNIIKSSLKNDGSPLSEADMISNDFILSELKLNFPDIPVLTEERSWMAGESNYYFAVDLLDGTKEFFSRNGEFTVNIALVVNGFPVIGIVHAPALGFTWAGVNQGETYSLRRSQTSHGYGEWVAISDNPSEPKATIEPFKQKIRVTLSRSHLSSDTAIWLKSLKKPYETLPKGSSLKFCLLADGEADLYPRIRQTKVWDTAAGHAVLVGAGGKVLLQDLTLPLKYLSVLDPLNKSFVAIRHGLRVQDLYEPSA